jgi:tRNA modification GTPase
MNDTIAAIATAGGVGSIAIVRLSGPDARTCARHVAPKATFRPRYAQLTPLVDLHGAMIDQGIVLSFEAPHSFTGEEVVEFQCHGGTIIARRILETLLRAGARLAEPGEFSKRAFLNGKIDLSQAEAIAKMIEAKSVRGAQLLARHLQGELGRYVSEVREALLRLLAHSEVSIDYAEEIDEGVLASIVEQLGSLIASARTLLASSRRRQGMIDGFRVAIVGKPNVGKSSLLNGLLAYERAIVSDIAGTTRDTIEETLFVGEHAVRLIDTAGIRTGTDTIERIGVERSVASLREADAVLALFDGSRPFDEEDRQVVRLLEELDPQRVTAIVNKVDLPQRLDTTALERWPLIRMSIDSGIDGAIEALERLLDALSEGEDLMLVSAHQMAAVELMADRIEAARGPLEIGELELFSFHLREAIDAIGSITHPYEDHEILDRMFGEFCLGK